MLKLNTFLKFVTCKCAFSSIQIKHFAKHIALWITFQNVLVWEPPIFKFYEILLIKLRIKLLREKNKKSGGFLL